METMKLLGKITFLLLVLIAGVYWAVSNPGKAKSVKKTVDSVIETARDAVND